MSRRPDRTAGPLDAAAGHGAASRATAAPHPAVPPLSAAAGHRTASPPAARPTRLGAAAAAAILVAAGLLSWSEALGVGELLALPAGLFAVALAARRLPATTAIALVPAWLVAAPLIAGLPLAVLQPSAWPTTATALTDAAQQLSTVGGAHGAGGWPLALALAVAGTSWLVGGALAVDRGLVRALSFVLLAAPMAAANLLQADVAWQGAALIASALLWLSPRRAVLATSGAVAVAVLALAVTDMVRPEGRWLVSSASAAGQPAFSSLDTQQSYGRLDRDRKGRTMFEITADAPGLWRATVLERFDGRIWKLNATGSALPEPAARSTTSTVHVRGLKDDLVVAPGRVTAVSTPGRRHPWLGGSWVIDPQPSRGDTYTVRSAVVAPSTEQLAAVPFTTDPSALAFTNTTTDIGIARSDPAWLGVQRLSRSVTAGATTPLQAVEQVQSYLVDSGRFRYTTDVDDSEDPIVNFLLQTHRGYCQHFAGAAALLLRMAGVPTRVVVGFATGRDAGDGTYSVRDTDAHAWIEVYFDGIGWVPFNPTPGSADAAVSAAATPVVAAAGAHRSGGEVDAVIAAAGGVVLIAGGGVLLRRRRRRVRAAVMARGAGRAAGAPPKDPLAAGLERIAGPLPPRHTLTQLRTELAARVGPRTAALAVAVERGRYAPSPPPPPRHPRRILWRAVRADVGALRAIVLLLRRRPAARVPSPAHPAGHLTAGS